MKVQELFRTIPYDNIANALQHTHFPEEKDFISISANYKEAYDQLCNIESNGEAGEVTFDVTPREEWGKPHSLPMLANGVEGELWENIVGKEVVRPDPNPFTDEELAGSILWGSTFYGFTPQSRRECFDEMFPMKNSHFAVQAERLEIKRVLFYIRNRKERRLLKEQLENGSERPFGLPGEMWDFLHERKKHLNRSKRKREYRQEKRIRQLENLDRRFDLLKRIGNDYKECESDFIAELSKQVYAAKEISEVWLETFTYGKTKRVDYITELLTKYGAHLKELLKDSETLNLFVWASQDFPLTQEERENLTDFLKHFNVEKENQVNTYFGSIPTDDQEIRLQHIYIK